MAHKWGVTNHLLTGMILQVPPMILKLTPKFYGILGFADLEKVPPTIFSQGLVKDGDESHARIRKKN